MAKDKNDRKDVFIRSMRLLIMELKKRDKKKILTFKVDLAGLDDLDPNNVLKLVAYAKVDGRSLGINLSFDSWIGHPSWSVFYKELGFVILSGRVDAFENESIDTAVKRVAQFYIDLVYGRLMFTVFNQKGEHIDMQGEKIDGIPFAVSIYARSKEGLLNYQLTRVLGEWVRVEGSTYSISFETAFIDSWRGLSDKESPEESSILTLETLGDELVYELDENVKKDVKDLSDVIAMQGTLVGRLKK